MSDSTGVGAKRGMTRAGWTVACGLALGALLWAGVAGSQALSSGSTVAPTSWAAAQGVPLVAGIEDLVGMYNAIQGRYVSLLLPGQYEPIIVDAGEAAMKDGAFTDSFLAGLVEVKDGKLSTYPVFVVEDGRTGERRVLNARLETLAVVKPPEGYEPGWYVKRRYPAAVRETWTSDQRRRYEGGLDVGRLVGRFALLRDEWPLDERAVDQKAAQSDLAPEVLTSASPVKAPGALPGGGAMMAMMEWAGGSVTSLQFVAIDEWTNRVHLLVAYPDDYTNGIDLFGAENLATFLWTTLLTTNPAAGTNTISWVDMVWTNGSFEKRFYALANADADSDADGLPDGRERYVYGTDPSEWDTDGDGVGDGMEIEKESDPLDGDDPLTLRGVATYDGMQTGAVWVVATTNAGSWSTNWSTIADATGAFTVAYLDAGKDYWAKAWLDADGDGRWDQRREASGSWSGNPASSISSSVSGVNLEISEPPIELWIEYLGSNRVVLAMTNLYAYTNRYLWDGAYTTVTVAQLSFESLVDERHYTVEVQRCESSGWQTMTNFAWMQMPNVEARVVFPWMGWEENENTNNWEFAGWSNVVRRLGIGWDRYFLSGSAWRNAGWSLGSTVRIEMESDTWCGYGRQTNEVAAGPYSDSEWMEISGMLQPWTNLCGQSLDMRLTARQDSGDGYEMEGGPVYLLRWSPGIEILGW